MQREHWGKDTFFFSTAFGLKHEGTVPQLLVEKQERNDVTQSLVATLQESCVCQLVNGYLSWDPEVEVCVRLFF